MKAFHKYLEQDQKEVFFVARADSLPELFKECALAVEGAAISTETVQPKEQIKILGENATAAGLLFDFLDELVFFKDYKQLVFGNFEIDINEAAEKGDKFSLTCLAKGEKIHYIRHEPKADIKSVDKQRFKLENTERGWKAQVLLKI
ncbi:MAG TPA: archease [Candidatus Nanoarchaeia archaeon]|nr:archease [Candidatus Nanoarchaeia archaeon]